MRKFMFLLLLAGAATPAIAAGQPDDNKSDEARSERHQARQQARELQSQRAEQSGGGSDRPYPDRSLRSNDGGQGPAAVQIQGENGGGRAIEGRRQHFGGR